VTEGWPTNTSKPLSRVARVFRSAAFTGAAVAFLAFAVGTYQYTSHNVKTVIWFPAAAVHTWVEGHCTPSNPSLPKPEIAKECVNGPILFGSFFLFYFLLGFGAAAAVAAIRRRTRKED